MNRSGVGMKVLLVQPRQRRRGGFKGGFRSMALVEPLGLEMIAGALHSEHEVRIVDLLPRVSLERAVESFRPDACGISCSFTVDVGESLEIAKTVKTLWPRSFVFVGGHHASLSPGDFAVPWVDAVVLGEGEATTPHLLHALACGESLETVPGLVVNTERGQLPTGLRPLISNLDDLPFAARSLVSRWSRGYHLGLRGRLASIETSRGCPYRCTFCSVWRFHQGRVRFKSPERVVDELESIEMKNIFITDDNFLASIRRAERIADLLLERGVRKRYIFQARTDSVARHPETMAKLKEAGFVTVFLGLEKIDQGELQDIGKANTVETNEAALSVLKKVGMNTYGTLIVDPDYDERDFGRLRDYVRRHAIPNAWFTVLTPLPGTALFEQLQEALITRDWELFDLAHAVLPTKLGLEKFYREYARLYTTVYSPKVLLRRAASALFRRRPGGWSDLPSLSLIWRSLESLRCMTDPREYLHAHVGGSSVESN
ncbi:MAG: B12-binding domain-containing radical SAM protein [Thermoleophilia bacterium]|nr:B12-binding domain-containing radical SAM protein [Thermoleophilia bacterium]